MSLVKVAYLTALADGFNKEAANALPNSTSGPAMPSSVLGKLSQRLGGTEAGRKLILAIEKNPKLAAAAAAGTVVAGGAGAYALSRKKKDGK